MTIETLLRAGKRTVLAGVAATLIGAVAVPSSVSSTAAADGPVSVTDLPQLASGAADPSRQHGETQRGWLGMRIRPVTAEIAESLGMATVKGALVAGVITGGPIDNGTIETGDVIIKFDGKDIGEISDLARVVAESPAGKTVDVVIVRKGAEQTIKVTLGRLEDGEKLAEDKGNGDNGQVTTISALGMTLGALNGETRKTFGIAANMSGVVITDVTKDSLAAERNVHAGDVIVEVFGKPVSTPRDVVNLIDAAKDQNLSVWMIVAVQSGEARRIINFLRFYRN